jgi:membrane-associated protein
MLEFFDITNLIIQYGYIGIFSIVFLESGVFFALPGDSLLFTVGVLASTHILSIWVVIPLIFIATFTGALTGYQIGVHLKRLNNYSLFRKILQKKHIDTAEKFFAKYGKFTIVFSRFVPLVRTFAPIVAGVVRMPYTTFLKYSLIGSILWSTSITLLGYFLGRVIPEIKDYMSLFIIAVVLLSLVPAVYEVIKEQRKNRN